MIETYRCPEAAGAGVVEPMLLERVARELARRRAAGRTVVLQVPAPAAEEGRGRRLGRLLAEAGPAGRILDRHRARLRERERRRHDRRGERDGEESAQAHG